MKALSLLILVLVLERPVQNKYRLVGKYKLVPNYRQAYSIKINDSVYTKTFSNGEMSNGVVAYWENVIYLRDYEKELKEIDFQWVYVESRKLKEINLISLRIGKKKSIDYCHHVLTKDGPENWLDVCSIWKND